MRRNFTILLMLVLLVPGLARAHSLNDSFLDLSVDGNQLTGVLQVAVTDLEIAVGVDSNSDGKLTWGELIDAAVAINDYLFRRVQVSRDGRSCTLAPGAYLMADLAGGAYLTVPLAGHCPVNQGDLTLSYDLMFDVDRSHRGIIKLQVDTQSSTQMLTPTRRSLSLVPDQTTVWRDLAAFVNEGAWHIWMGIDHLLFVLAMLLAVVLRPGHGNTTGAEVVRLITAFTLAHSLTLALATLGWVSLPPRLVETAIAVSVVVSGINVMVPIFRHREWIYAGIFGLIHGFGFASVLADLNLKGGQFLLGLFGFNLGVELGQLLVVLIALPAIGLLAGNVRSRRWGAAVSGLVIAHIGVIWFIERGF